MQRSLLSSIAILVAVGAGSWVHAQDRQPFTEEKEQKGETRPSEVLLRQHIEGMRAGKPIYELMNPTIVAAVKPYEEIGRRRFAQLGAIRSIEFRGQHASGADVYLVQYENGASEYLIALNSDGKISALYVSTQ